MQNCSISISHVQIPQFWTNRTEETALVFDTVADTAILHKAIEMFPPNSVIARILGVFH